MQDNRQVPRAAEEVGSAELAELVARHALKDGGQKTAVPSLHLYRSSTMPKPVHAVYRPSLCLIVQGSKVVTLGAETWRYDPRHFSLVSVNLPVVARRLEASPTRPHLGLHLDLDLAVIAALVAELPPAARQPNPAQTGLSVGVLEPLLKGAVVRLVGLLNTPEHIPTLAPLIMREVCYLLLTGPEGHRLRATALAASQTHRIVTAVEWLVRNYDQPLKVERLAEEVHMSVSGFHHHFKAVTNLSPLQYQKQLRLQEARRLLLGHEANVAKASLRVGYVSPSQFSREYRQLFGVSPRQDAASSYGRMSLER